jgi:hypothetical protein
MSRLGRFPLFAFLLCLSGAALGACQALAGIDDRTYDPDGGSADQPPSQACKDYCALADANCPDPQAPNSMPSSTLYISDAACLHTCALLTPGDPSTPQPQPKPGDNTVACRDAQLGFVTTAVDGPGQKASYCASAGPGGNDTCGSNCQSYCQLYRGACKDWWAMNMGPVAQAQAQFDQDTCVTNCLGLKDTQSFSASIYDMSGSSNYMGDTLECRLVHTSAAAFQPSVHCVHAALQPQPMTPCQDMTWPPDYCASFCQLEMTACTGDNKIYESLDQCKAVCKYLPQGSPTDTNGNTVGCRKYHSYNALFNATIHCQHTGPGSEGLCEDDPASMPAEGNCQSYCLLLQKACPSDFKATCETDCKNVNPAPSAGYSYSVAPGNLPTGPNVECRLLHVSRALVLLEQGVSDATECAKATGAAACN